MSDEEKRRARKWIVRVFGVVSLAFNQCVDEWSIPVADDYPLVVDATITDGPGPHTVNLYRSVGVNERAGNNGVDGATVTLLDSDGGVEVLQRKSQGVYQTSASFFPQQGRDYVLRIETADGDIFESTAERVLPGPPIDSLYAVYVPPKFGNLGEEILPASMRVYASAKVESGNDHFYRWRWEGVYEFKTFPELRVKKMRDVELPDPVPCSGYVAQGGTIRYVGPPCYCCRCWITEKNDKVAIESVDAGDANTLAKAIADVAIDRRHFFNKYHITVQQLRISHDAFLFWEKVEKQNESSGNIFQPNATRIKGNMRRVQEASSEELFGFFSIASMQEREMFIERDDVPTFLQPIDTVREACLLLKYSTNQEPEFWQ